MQEAGGEAGKKSGSHAPILAAVQLALGQADREGEAAAANNTAGEGLAARIAALEISHRAKAGHETLLVSMRKQIDCLLHKKADSSI